LPPGATPGRLLRDGRVGPPRPPPGHPSRLTHVDLAPVVPAQPEQTPTRPAPQLQDQRGTTTGPRPPSAPRAGSAPSRRSATRRRSTGEPVAPRGRRGRRRGSR